MIKVTKQQVLWMAGRMDMGRQRRKRDEFAKIEALAGALAGAAVNLREYEGMCSTLLLFLLFLFFFFINIIIIFFISSFFSRYVHMSVRIKFFVVVVLQRT